MSVCNRHMQNPACMEQSRGGKCLSQATPPLSFACALVSSVLYWEMVKAVKGVLLECDTTVKQIVLNLNQKGNFVIEDLDDTHLFIEASWVKELQYELDKILDENAYTIVTDDREGRSKN